MANCQHKLFLVCGVLITSSYIVTIVACDIEHSEQFVCGHGKLEKTPALRFSFSELPMNETSSATNDGSSRQKRSPGFESIRIHTHYDLSLWKLETSQLEVIRLVIPTAVSYVQSTLKVRRRTKPINIPRDCSDGEGSKNDTTGVSYCQSRCQQYPTCYDTQVPMEHAATCYEKRAMFTRPGLAYTGGPGVSDTDYILYVASQPTEQCLSGETVAYAASCLQDEHDFRCPRAQNTARQLLGFVVRRKLSYFGHTIRDGGCELVKCLIQGKGFSSGLYPFFLNENGKPWTQLDPTTGYPVKDKYGDYIVSDNVVKTVINPNWKVTGGVLNKETRYIVTPRVREEVRRHFNCGELIGAPLEDQEETTSSSSHWEKRVFMNEIMTTSVNAGAYVMSRLTLALLEDTGWYRADFTQAGEMMWGRNLGCDFVTQSCFQWMQTRMDNHQSVRPFCLGLPHKLLDTGCSDHHDALTYCAIVRYDTDIPLTYRNFLTLSGVPQNDIQRYGGVNKFADYCPTNEMFLMQRSGGRISSSVCQFESNSVDDRRNVALERHGKGSKCFEQFGVWTAESSVGLVHASRTGSGCYKYKCHGGNETYDILVGTRPFHCRYKWQMIQVTVTYGSRIHRGSLMCPPHRVICQMTPPPSAQHLRELSMDEARMQAKVLMSSAKVSVITSNYCVFVITFLLRLY